MRYTRTELENLEQNNLAPYAQLSAKSTGRIKPEPPHPYRTHYQRDRSRIVHSRAFRRLEAKTQVFLSGGSGDHVRNRLTHTIEVASVSRTTARALGLNEDLAEAIALAHDLGHSPFGHSGEMKLNELMQEWGGFEHNLQSLRVVQLLEDPYPNFDGLNLTYEVLEGLRKHEKFHESLHGDTIYLSPSLEAQITNLADEITYYSHDLEDGLDLGLLHHEQLQELEIWVETETRIQSLFPHLQGEKLRRYIVRSIIDREVEDLIQASHEAIEASGVQSVEAVRSESKPLIQYSVDLLKKNRELRKFLYANLYYSPRVTSRNRAACRLLEDVFIAYRKNPAHLGNRAIVRIETEGLERTVCDYISGMTDLYLIKEHARLFPDRNEERRVLEKSQIE